MLKKKTKKKGSLKKKKKQDALSRAASQYAKVQRELSDYREEYADEIQGFLDLHGALQTAEAELKAEAKNVAKGYGSHKMCSVAGMELVVDIRKGNRKADAAVLIEARPDLSTWEGLLTVKMAEFDKAVAAGMIPADLVADVVTHGDDIKSATFVPEV